MALLLLDLDNTVADREAAFSHWVEDRLAAWAPGDDDARAFLREFDCDGFRPRVEFLAGVRERFSLQDSVETLLDEYRRATLFGFPPMDATAKKQLRDLRVRGWSIAVVTNGESGVQEATADRIGLSPLLDACVVSETVGIRKPDPRIFALAAERCGRSASGAWMVGDADVDVVGAASAGMRSVWLARGREWQRDDVIPDVVAPNLCDALVVVSCAGGPA